VSSAENYELQKIESTIGNNYMDETFNMIKNSYKEKAEKQKSEKKK
jgi:hypothetical protein